MNPIVVARSQSSPVKQVAGSIAHTTRASEPPVLSAVGASSVNQATKAIAVARSYLEGDSMELFVEAERPGYDDQTNTIRELVWLALSTKRHERAVPEDELTGLTELRSANTTGTALLAGAIAKSVREKKQVRYAALLLELDELCRF
jgi:stage V sporulation protein SpoVS